MKRRDRIVFKKMFGVLLFAVSLILILIKDGRDSKLFEKELDELQSMADEMDGLLDEWVAEDE